MIDVKRPVETSFPGYFVAPIDEFCEMAKSGVTAIYLYSSNVFKNGEVKKFDAADKSVRTMKKSGVTAAPVSLFTDFLGAEMQEKGGDVILALGEKRAVLGSELPLFTEGAIKLADVNKTAEALGLNFATFAEDRLTVFAGDGILTALKNDKMLMRGACYAVFGKYSTDGLTHEDFVFAKKKWRTTLVGNEEINDPTDPDAKKKLDAISDRCDSLLSNMHREADAVILWGDEPPVNSCDLRTQYLNVLAIAEAYGTYGTRQYKTESLAEDIRYAFLWMYENMYGESIIEGRGWRDPHLFNWWEWMTGAIDPMTDALLIAEELFDIETIRKYLRCYDYVCTFHRTYYREDHASTRLKVGTKVALLLEDSERLYYRFLDYDLQFEPIGPQKGKYSDHVCWTHRFPYNMMYGLIYMNRTLFVASNLIGTAMEYTSPDFYDFFLTAKYMYDAAMYRGRGFAVFRGRGFGGEKDSGSNVLNGILPMLGAFGAEEDIFIKRMIKVGCADPEVKRMLLSRCSVRDLALIKSILADESISDENDKELAYSWFTADRFAQHRNDYAFMLAMASERHMSYESINSAHKMGWYTGDGALYLYTNADSESFNFSAFQSNPAVCYRMPGVTADLRPRAVWSYRHGWKPSKAYSGSMDFDGLYGMGAFDYEPYHYEGHEAEGTTDDGYGGGFTYHENDLTAKKSYFFFDKECVCLGAGISSTMNSPVRTTVEHRRLVDGARKITVNGKEPASEYVEEIVKAPAYVTLEGVASYVFPEACDVRVAKYSYDPAKAKSDHYHEDEKLCANDYFELGIEHGENPKDASYSYVILPLADENSTRVYASCPETEIISNTAELQAVRKKSLGITAAALFKAGEIGPVCASVPCLIMYKETGGELNISICDPTQKLETGEFTVVGNYECTSASDELSVECGKSSCVIKADFTSLAGKSLVITLKNK